MNLQLDKVCSTSHRVSGGVRMTNLCQTLSTCQQFNAEVCYGSGLKYDTEACTATVKQQVEDFLLDNALPSYFLGVCQDFKQLNNLLTLGNVQTSLALHSLNRRFRLLRLGDHTEHRGHED